MTRLYRPYIPLRVRIRVAERQAFGKGIGWLRGCDRPDGISDSEWLDTLLSVVFQKRKVELHHRPALMNRPSFRLGLGKKIYYEPDANDPDYLVYLPVDEHDIETRVRGQRGQHSDLALARKRKRKERKAKRRKTKWPKQKLRSASRWPAKRFDRRWSGYRIDAPRRKS